MPDTTDDFGHIVRRRPLAVVRPHLTTQVSELVRFADNNDVTLVSRGQGHSTFGQAQSDGGILLDTGGMDEIHLLGAQVIAGAGATWDRVLDVALASGLTPPVLTDYLQLSVGGTLSAGGTGGTTFRHGAQVDTVRSLDVVTADGRLHTCIQGSPLANAVLGGLGQCGVITSATLNLVPAPRRVRWLELSYRSLTDFLNDQRAVLADRRFDYLEGRAKPGGHFVLEAAVFDRAENLDGLLFTDAEIREVDYREFAHRTDPGVAELSATGDWFAPHPWLNVWLPDSAVEGYLTEALRDFEQRDIGAGGLVLIYPVRTALLRAPLLRMPDEPVAFLFAVLRNAPPADPDTVRAMLDRNRALYRRAVELGGTLYPVGSVPLTEREWAAHWGEQLPAARAQFDPSGLFQQVSTSLPTT
ncbi:FAD-binding protein [Pseudonocardiaceae bacterium YIM PH 21723]|nr:FAD-binding protein [Pseudonocardiaceae bacterium YIM PH 21723]